MVSPPPELAVATVANRDQAELAVAYRPAPRFGSRVVAQRKPGTSGADVVLSAAIAARNSTDSRCHIFPADLAIKHRRIPLVDAAFRSRRDR